MTPNDDAIPIPDPPAIPGLRFRHYRGPDDLPALAAVSEALVDAGQTDYVITAESLANFFAHENNLNPLRDVALAEVDGVVVGYARCFWGEELNGPLLYHLNSQVRPAWQGRGITRALLYWAEAHLRQTAAGHAPDREKFFQCGLPQGQAGLQALLVAEGYTPVRYGFRMVRPSLDDIPDFPLPPGLDVRPAQPAHYRPIWDADLEAFRDHWGYIQRTEEDYQMWLNDPVWFQPDLWQVAWDAATDEVAGMVLTYIDHAENEKFQRRRGYTEGISVRRPWRRRGLARALIARSLRLQKALGMTESALSVDAENLSGATRIYEDCGFRTVSVDTLYRKALQT